MISIFAPIFAFAGQIFFETEKSKIPLNSEFLVNVFLDTEVDKINTIEGEISLSKNLEVKKIIDGNSSVNLWINKPEINNVGNIYFSGMTPGGIVGKRVFLFAFTLSSNKAGLGSINLNSATAFKSDGLGTKISLTSKSLDVEADSSLEKVKTEVGIIDNDPPEDFLPTISKNEFLFDGKNFLVFSTQDKGSGIHHYEVREGFWGKYNVTESPYLLKNQDLDRRIYVKAVDNSDNVRVSVINKTDVSMWYIYSIIIIAIMFLFLRKRYGKKNINNI